MGDPDVWKGRLLGRQRKDLGKAARWAGMQGGARRAVSRVRPEGEAPANTSICPRVSVGLAEHRGCWTVRRNPGEQ